VLFRSQDPMEHSVNMSKYENNPKDWSKSDKKKFVNDMIRELVSYNEINGDYLLSRYASEYKFELKIYFFNCTDNTDELWYTFKPPSILNFPNWFSPGKRTGGRKSRRSSNMGGRRRRRNQRKTRRSRK